MLLAELALVYWRPDFTPGQARQLYTQFLDDLRAFSFADIRDAIISYRRNGENKFYPTPGQLRALITDLPSWDVGSKKDHIAGRLHAAKLELERAAEEIRLSLPAPQKLHVKQDDSP